jgi:G:T-mismatch repair DNA endonuclease (very short patch repair protein)
VLPNEITFTALFKILNSCGPVDKADRAKYWAEKIQDKRILDDPFVANQLEQLGWTGNRKRS